MIKCMTIIILGVAGSGKSTVGTLLAHDLAWEYLDADDFHSASNRNKMQSGHPLNDHDRRGWLTSIQAALVENYQSGKSVVLACSALKETYREMLRKNPNTRFVYLSGTFAQIEERLDHRRGHYMSSKLLASQFEILEEPEYAITIDISNTPAEIVELIRKGYDL